MAKNELNVSSIARLLSGDGLQSISKSTGAKPEQVASVVSNAIPMLLSGMEKNAGSKDGADSLSKALGQHKTGDVKDVGKFLDGVDTDDGKKILKHILGKNETATTKALAERSGLSASKVTKILAMVAPLLLSLLGNKKDEEEQQPQTQQGGVLSLLGSVLGSGSQQQSGGGNLDGLASMAMSILGGGSQETREPAQEESNGGLLSGLLSLFH